MIAYREKRRGRGVRGCCKWYLIWAGPRVSLQCSSFTATAAVSRMHTNSGILLIPFVASLVGGCGREVCALLLLLGQTSADGGEGSLGAP
jgi:hypothetical protein